MLAPDNYEAQPELVEFVLDMMLETSPDGVVGALAAILADSLGVEAAAVLAAGLLLLAGTGCGLV